MDVRSARHRAGLGRWRQLGAAAPDHSQFQRPRSIRRLGAGPRPEHAQQRQPHEPRRFPCLRAPVGDRRRVRHARADGSRPRRCAHPQPQCAVQGGPCRQPQDQVAHPDVRTSSPPAWSRSKSPASHRPTWSGDCSPNASSPAPARMRSPTRASRPAWSIRRNRSTRPSLPCAKFPVESGAAPTTKLSCALSESTAIPALPLM